MVFKGDGPELMGGFDFQKFLKNSVANVAKVTGALVDKPEPGAVPVAAPKPFNPLIIGGVAAAGVLGLVLLLKRKR